MGDNRDNSLDSRISAAQSGVGYVPAVNLVGRAEVLFFSTDYSVSAWEFWGWFGALRFSRFFRAIE
jgi:signal peptidase I